MTERLSMVFVGAILTLVILFCGCFSDKETEEYESNVYVSVNGISLTETELKTLIPEDVFNGLAEEHKKEIIEDWVNHELLYQEALLRGIDKRPEISRILENSKRTLLKNELIENINIDVKDPDDETLKSFYEEHKDYFILFNDEYKIRHVLFDTEKETKDFWTKVKAGERFTELARESSKDPNFHMGGEYGIINKELVEPGIWIEIVKTVNELGIMKISNPFAVVDGWMCIIVDKVFKKGDVLPFEAVRDQLLDMYMVEKRQEARDSFLKELHEKAEINYRSLN